MTGAVLHFLVGIAVVGSLLWGASRFAERWKTGGHRVRDEPLRVVSRRSLAKGVSVVRLSVEDRDLLLGATSKGVELICELPKTPGPAPVLAATTTYRVAEYGPDGQPARPSFAEALTRSLALKHRKS